MESTSIVLYVVDLLKILNYPFHLYTDRMVKKMVFVKVV